MELETIDRLPLNFRKGIRTLPEDCCVVGWGAQINETHFQGKFITEVYRSLETKAGDVLFVKKPIGKGFEDDLLYAAPVGSPLSLVSFYTAPEVEIERRGLIDLVTALLDHVSSSPSASLARIRAVGDMKEIILIPHPTRPC